MRIALGVFDGVHRGHQKIIEKAHLVLTITPHPNPDIQLLTSPAEKKELIGNIAEFKFSPKNSKLSPEEFINWLCQKYKPESIFVGHDFHFGYLRQGNVSILRQLGQKYNFSVTEIPEYNWQKETVRSSAIRKYLAAGEIKKANALLGREYQLNGKIIRGRRIGRRLGFPTINIKPDHPQKLLPADGVYQAEVIVKNKLFPAGIFIGQGKCEAHLLGFNGNLYGHKAVVFFKDHLRDNKKFTSREALSRQIRKDINKINKLIRHQA